MRGKFKGKQGKVTAVKLNISKIIIEGIQVKKQDGSKVNIKLQPSNLQIIELNLEDRRRKIKKESKEKIKEDKTKKEVKKKEDKENSKEKNKEKKK